ncbi:uncharacterized protein F4822DRAFT_42168 [Hypoxylon trugodes]|uniref:uncharacterized protein n=1 Tax=Hypoxylon trugodes TaxID=326681 RepID=UPI0021A148E5|nr:uncharacterized protein F4822DRAFT_42168 [Hypoxylon trugodes]KAI1394231.1 hypothetical protein F4822DRAFT_42168 [Hypoxylon trugodes]
MDSVRDFLAALGHYYGVHEANLRRVGTDVSRGLMTGAAIALSVFIHHENTFYQSLAFYIFAVSLILFNVLNREAVMRHFYLALVTVVVPALITLPRFEISVSFLLGRVPILLMAMSLLVEEYSRRFVLNSHHWERAPDVPPDAIPADEHGGFRMYTGNGDELFAHMNGGERYQYHAQSSDISLSTRTGRLPSSADTIIHSFWNGELDPTREYREENKEQEQTG